MRTPETLDNPPKRLKVQFLLKLANAHISRETAAGFGSLMMMRGLCRLGAHANACGAVEHHTKGESHHEACYSTHEMGRHHSDARGHGAVGADVPRPRLRRRR